METRGVYRVHYGVSETRSSGLSPVTLSVDTGAAHFQDYLTPDEADALAAELTAVATIVRGAKVAA